MKLDNPMKRMCLLPTTMLLAAMGCAAYEDPTPVPTISKSESAEEEATSGAVARPSLMPIYITPYYNSEGPEVAVGKFSEDLRTATVDTITAVTTSMKSEWDTLGFEAMYVAAIRLYDFGLKDEATYWFYAAQLRARLLGSLIKKESIGGIGSQGFELMQAHAAFHQLAGTYINGYAFGDLVTLKQTIERAKTDSEKIPQFATIYPGLILNDELAWAASNQEIVEGVDKLLEHIENNADEIKATRKQNGIEGKY